MKNGTLSLTSEKGGDEDHDKKIFEDFFVYRGFVFSPTVVFRLEEELTLFIVISNPALGFPILMVAIRRHFTDTGQFLGDSDLIPAEILASDLTRDILSP